MGEVGFSFFNTTMTEVEKHMTNNNIKRLCCKRSVGISISKLRIFFHIFGYFAF